MSLHVAVPLSILPPPSHQQTLRALLLKSIQNLPTCHPFHIPTLTQHHHLPLQPVQSPLPCSFSPLSTPYGLFPPQWPEGNLEHMSQDTSLLSSRTLCGFHFTQSESQSPPCDPQGSALPVPSLPCPHLLRLIPSLFPPALLASSLVLARSHPRAFRALPL